MRATATTELFVRELGRSAVVTVDDDDFARYRGDESPVRGDPDVVVLPASADEVLAALQLAATQSIAIVPRGAGSGKCGGAVPVRGGLVLCLERMRRIVDVSEGNLVATVEAGAITSHIDAAAAELGLYYPPDPASLEYSTIGGNIATNAGGPSAFKYGSTGAYVLSLDVALASGERLRVGRHTAKGVSGIDLSSVFVGSEGTLGVVLGAELRLIPRPPERATLLATFAKRSAAGDAVTRVCTSGLWPRTLELIDERTLALVRAHLARPLPPGAAALLVEVDGTDALAQAEACGQVLHAAGAEDIAVAPTEAEGRALWAARRAISPALKAAYPHKVSEDICLPRQAVPAILDDLDGIAAELGLEIAAYGHAGDGNLHVNFLFAEPVTGARAQTLERALESLFDATIARGGTLSGEHGIGVTKRRFMPIEHSPEQLAWQRRAKALFDPDGRMNPGKLLPDPL